MLKLKRKITIFSWILVILWMVFIFSMSSKVREESNDLSQNVTRVSIKIIERVTPITDIDIDEFNYIIRKSAHLISYMILAILMTQALRISKVKGYRLYIISLILCIIYAISDEIHQSFVPGRGPQLLDVIIDTSGASIGIIGNYFMIMLYRRKILDNKIKKNANS